MTSTWTLAVARDDLSRTELREDALREVDDGEALLRVDRVGVTDGAAFLLAGEGRQLAGLTSPGNVSFTESLGCYDRVLTYDDAPQLAALPTAYIDLAGSTQLRRTLHDHLGADLVLDLVVGVTHQDSSPAGTLAGARPQVFFAPGPDASALGRLGPAGARRPLRAGVAPVRAGRRGLGRRHGRIRTPGTACGLARGAVRTQRTPHRARPAALDTLRPAYPVRAAVSPRPASRLPRRASAAAPLRRPRR